MLNRLKVATTIFGRARALQLLPPMESSSSNDRPPLRVEGHDLAPISRLPVEVFGRIIFAALMLEEEHESRTGEWLIPSRLQAVGSGHRQDPSPLVYYSAERRIRHADGVTQVWEISAPGLSSGPTTLWSSRVQIGSQRQMCFPPRTTFRSLAIPRAVRRRIQRWIPQNIPYSCGAQSSGIIPLLLPTCPPSDPAVPSYEHSAYGPNDTPLHAPPRSWTQVFVPSVRTSVAKHIWTYLVSCSESQF